MNVVHFFPYSARVSGGHNNAIHSFIACQRARGIDSVGISPLPDEAQSPKEWGFPLAEVDSLYDLRWRNISECFGFGPRDTLVNFYSVSFGFIPLMKDLRREKVPYVLTEQGQLSFQNAARWLKKFLYLNFFNRSIRKAAGLHVLTRFTAARLKFLVPGYPGEVLAQGNLATVPNADRPIVSERSSYGIPEDSFVLLFIGRLDIWTKGLDRVVEAFSRLPQRFRLILAGPDWQDGQAKLEALAERLGSRNRICFPGPVYGEKKWSALRLADLFVSPSRKEGFGIALAEAMSCNLPVLTSTRINLAPELKEADAAFLVPPVTSALFKAMTLLGSDPELRAGYGRRGKLWFETNCNPDRAGFRFREFFQSILDKQKA